MIVRLLKLVLTRNHPVVIVRCEDPTGRSVTRGSWSLKHKLNRTAMALKRKEVSCKLSECQRTFMQDHLPTGIQNKIPLSVLK